MSSSPPAETIQAIFNRIAPVYNQFNDGLSFGMHRVWKQMAVSWSNAAAGDTCLDLCCGSGDLARLLAQRVGATGQVYGLDFSTELLAIAHQQTQQRVQPLSITWVEGDALNLPFEANTFDAVTMGYGLRNVVDIPASLRELHRVLKPGATAAILDFHRPRSVAVQAFQQWYLDTLVVPMAARFGMREEYAYIAPSLERFPIGSQQVRLAQSVGFGEVVHYAIAGGMMGILVATKPQ
ncbi:MAG: bifunctional demethylmenaquinone methyltransferase/2-methoxy-6-polyprenyl-1,4-benzoquinol methylase UbiE [Kaiparowitsia implicata GSE-PSE-MK54-09C]|jgi:demethylmenaquinone methyltransferase/2-methoxy-6-polyprenyl-1,4-benzoquinol methylase|nr:bifunctional demethylmenaquinone methyltransferase/2-methoxy-6-polyprenyl-1,4-benzoquinol methylase UbiE [Kaiparowitsia implicata GSE-PSE-MK54-09C]